MEELLLGAGLTLEELDVVEEQNVDTPKAGLEAVHPALPEGQLELVGEGLSGADADAQARAVAQHDARYRVQEVGLADARGTADEERVVGLPGQLCDGQRCGVCKAVGVADYEVLERKPWVAERVGWRRALGFVVLPPVGHPSLVGGVEPGSRPLRRWLRGVVSPRTSSMATAAQRTSVAHVCSSRPKRSQTHPRACGAASTTSARRRAPVAAAARARRGRWIRRLQPRACAAPATRSAPSRCSRQRRSAPSGGVGELSEGPQGPGEPNIPKAHRGLWRLSSWVDAIGEKIRRGERRAADARERTARGQLLYTRGTRGRRAPGRPGGP